MTNKFRQVKGLLGIKLGMTRSGRDGSLCPSPSSRRILALLPRS